MPRSVRFRAMLPVAVLALAVPFVAGCGGHTTAAPAGAPTTTAAPSTAAPSISAPSAAAPTSARTSGPPAVPRSTARPAVHVPARAESRTPVATATPAPAARQLPLAEPTGDATQVVTVVAPGTASTTATLQAWTRSGSGWLPAGPAAAAHTGSAGLTAHPSESVSATPIGSFTLTQAFGSAANPGTALPYFRTDDLDWWVSDPASPYYNTHYRCAAGSCPFPTPNGDQASSDAENLYTAGYVYTYAVNIDYHDTYYAGGSAFFLHVSDGGPTAGCVSIDEADLVSILRWLTPADHPRILIGV